MKRGATATEPKVRTVGGFDVPPCKWCKRETPCTCGPAPCRCTCGRCQYPFPLPDDGPVR